MAFVHMGDCKRFFFQFVLSSMGSYCWKVFWFGLDKWLVPTKAAL